MNYGVAVAAELRFYLIYAITNVTSGCCCEANPQTQSPRAARRSVAQSIARWFVNLHLAKKHFAFHLRCGVLSQKNTSKFCVCFVSENNKTGACESEFTHNEWRRWTSCYAQIQLKQQYVKRIMVCCKLVSSFTCSFFSLFFVVLCFGVFTMVCLCTMYTTVGSAARISRISWFSGSVNVCVCEYFNDQKFTTTMTAY